MKPVIEHFDYLGQPIKVGDYVSFTWAGGRGLRVGVVSKLTKQRVRMTFNNSYTHEGVKTYYTGNHIARPSDVLVLGEKLQQQLTMATLQKRI
jgi:hypothetical protein